MSIFPYDNTALDHLRSRCPRMGLLIDRCGHIERETTPDLFSSLVSSIVSQQISGKAAATVFGRLDTLCGGDVSPRVLCSLTADDIKACGMSFKKASYIHSAAHAALTGEVDFEALRTAPDEAVIKTLSSLPGIGVWTAEMLLIFSLHRPDVFSYGDFGIRRGLTRLHGLESVSKKEFDVYRALYSPHGSVASLYLWALAGDESLLP